jgi:iron complex outermembrane recepter protein
MTKKFYFAILFLLFGVAYGNAQSLSGRLVDSASGKPLEGASVYFPQLKIGAVTDADGNYQIGSLPKGIYDIEVHAAGHAAIIQPVKISGDEQLNFATIPSYSSLNQVVVTSLFNVTNIQRSPVPVSIVSHNTMLENSSNTAIDAVASQPGISETTEGVGTTKPQINGLGFDRVLVLTDGLPQEDFQWGDDHGILIDPYAVYDAEIIRGPASLQYGASAEAGVINFKTAPFAPNGSTEGSWLSEYHTNNGYIGNSFHIGGNHNGFVYDLRASGEIAHSYRNPKDGYVWGSAWNQGNARATFGINKSWGYSRLTLSALYRRIQVPDGNRDSATGRFLFDSPLGNGKIFPTISNFHSYDAAIAGDKILEEYQAWWQNHFNAGNGNIGIDIGLTSSVHYDIDSGTVGSNNMVVYDIPYSLKYQVTNAATGLKLTTGVNGIYEFEHNLPAPPPPYEPDYEIPNYRNFEVGGFAIVEKNIKALTVSGGLRYDITHFIGDGMWLDDDGNIVPEGTPGSTIQFMPFNNTYTGWSGSAGVSYQLPHNNYVKLNISKSFRAPAINELTSNGLNIGSNAFQLGNINLKPEKGYQVDLAYGYNGNNVSFEINGFYNHINDFIFADRTDSVSQGYPVYEFVSSNTAILTGASGYLNIHPSSLPWFEMTNAFSYIYTFLPRSTDSTKHIPWTPAPRLNTEFKFRLHDRVNSLLSGLYFKVGFSNYWAQKNIYSALYTELPSSSYILFNGGLGTDIVNRKTGNVFCSFYMNCTNLTNVAYADHLNLAQYFYFQNGNQVTVTNPKQGIYNMGRDITFKIVVPFGAGNGHETEVHGID